VAGMKANSTVILLIHPDFKPPKELELPEDMRTIMLFEGVVYVIVLLLVFKYIIRSSEYE